MRRMYHENREGKRRALYATSALVAILVLVDVVSGGAVRGAFRSVGAGVSRAGDAVSHGIFGGYFATRGQLVGENDALKAELSQYEERAAGYDALKTENDQLRTIVHLAEQDPGVTAPVVSSVRSSPYGTFMIGAGKTEGIVSGQLVVTPGGFAVGKVADVSAHSSLVSLLFAPKATVEGVTGNASLLLEGYGGGNARAEAPRDLPLTVGAVVFAPTLGERPIGVIGDIASSSALASQQVYVRLPVNLTTLTYVYVIR